jgi:hypothetical protein
MWVKNSNSRSLIKKKKKKEKKEKKGLEYDVYLEISKS